MPNIYDVVQYDGDLDALLQRCRVLKPIVKEHIILYPDKDIRRQPVPDYFKDGIPSDLQDYKVQ